MLLQPVLQHRRNCTGADELRHGPEILMGITLAKIVLKIVTDALNREIAILSAAGSNEPANLKDP